MKKSLIKWREDGDEEGAEPDFLEGGKGGLRREPTPFPKEMRAMAKRVQNMRNQQQVSLKWVEGVTMGTTSFFYSMYHIYDLVLRLHMNLLSLPENTIPMLYFLQKLKGSTNKRQGVTDG